MCMCIGILKPQQQILQAETCVSKTLRKFLGKWNREAETAEHNDLAIYSQVGWSPGWKAQSAL